MSYYGDGSNLTGITASQISGSLGALSAVKFSSISSEFNTSNQSFTDVPGLSSSFTATANSMFFVSYRLIISGRTSNSGGTQDRRNYYILRVNRNGGVSHDMHLQTELLSTITSYSYSNHPHMNGITQFELLGGGLRDLSGWAQDSSNSLYTAGDTVDIKLMARRDEFGQGSNVNNPIYVKVKASADLI